jgi:hypothetical protein
MYRLILHGLIEFRYLLVYCNWLCPPYIDIELGNIQGQKEWQLGASHKDWSS